MLPDASDQMREMPDVMLSVREVPDMMSVPDVLEEAAV